MFNLYTYEKNLKKYENSEKQKKKDKILFESRQSKLIK